MGMRRIWVFPAILSLIFMMSCGGGKKETVYDYPDGDSDDADISDVEISDKDTDDPQEPEEPDNTEKPDENPEEPEDHDDPETPDETPDEAPVDPEATESRRISGAVQAGSATSVALYECGGADKIAEADTDAKGKYSFKADISAAKTYCVKAGDLASCFKGMSDHVANISEITTAAYLLDKTCADMRKSETKIRTYTKIGTGEWLGELDYSGLSGINDGLKLLSSFIGSSDAETLSEKIAEDAKKESPEFAKLFNGFKVSVNKTEIVIGETADSNANFSVEGGSTKVAPNFKISWTVQNKTAEAASYKFTTSFPGEYTARAKLVSGSDTLSQDSATVLFLQKKNGGTVYVSDTSKDISFRIDDGIYGVIPKGTAVKKNGSKINSISYEVLTAGGPQVSRLRFRPEGAVFEGDSMYFIHELGTVFGGDPIMLSAKRANSNGSSDVLQSVGGDPIMLAAGGDPIMFSAGGDPIMQIAKSGGGDPIMISAAGDPIMTSAAGDPIMSAAAGDPIMASAAGDPIMASAAGDPIMMGTSSSVMISQTNHYSTFTVEAANLPVSVDNLVARWCDGSFYRGYSPIEFIKLGFQTYKPESSLLPYLTCEKFADLGNDLYELINKPVGFQRNLNLIENLFFVSEFYNRMKAKRESGAVAAVKNGLELRSAIAALYTATTSYNRSTTFADLTDSSLIPLTYSGNAPEDYTAKARNALAGNTEYAATKKEMMIFANYITTSSKGPDFSNVETVLTPDQLVCAWLDPDTEAANCNKVYTLNENGHVTLGGTEVSVAEANAIFTRYLMPMNSRLSNDEKLDLFRTFYLALKYAGTIFYNGSDVEELHDALLETAYLVFDGINGNMNAVSIVDTFDASAHTVAVLDGVEMATVPYLTKLSALTDQISLKVAAGSADVEKVIISIEGKEFEKVQENTRTYYKPRGEKKEKTIVLAPGNLSQGETALKTLLGSENVDSLGNITGKMTIVANSKISGKTYTTQKTYEFFVNNDSDGVNSKEVPANIQIFVNDSTGHAIHANANPTVILNPGNKVFYSENGVVSIENLTPAAYTVDAYADGYYAKSASVNVPAGATFSVEIRLDEELTGTADANLELKVNINTVKHPSKVYVQIYNDDMDLVANETAKFVEGTGKYETLNIEMNSGRYTLLAVGEDMYRYLEAITLYEGDNEKTITVVAKNACGNGIVDSAEECEPTLSEPVSCGTIYPASTYPEKSATCDPNTCTFNKSECGKAALCGDGILDEGEGCDGGSKACAEIAGFGNSTGSAPCAADCSGYITAGNCSKTTESCGNLPANALWNDGYGTFAQTYNGTNWLPAAKAATFGTTKEECSFSCAKGYKWNGSACIEAPLSLALICTGADSCSDNTAETECPAYGVAFFGQDAQYAEAGFCTPHTLSAAGNGIIKDAFTHYEWQASSSTAMNWSSANDYCSHLNDESGSSSLWRIPGPAELLTIVDSSTASPALGGIFTAKGHAFWASEDNRNSGNAWRVDENGALVSVAKTTQNSVLCVRTNEYDAPESRFTATAETVKDSVSGLMWQKQAVASRTWAEALNYCGEVSTNDRFDWRLPNRNELASLIDYEKTNGAMSGFPGIAAKGFWTSTSSVNETAKAWTVDFETGNIEATDKTSTKYIICVRNDEPCLGGECADPCSFNACKGMANSTGLCTADDYSFTCGCRSGFNWNHGKCLLATTRYIACEGLPENAVWNTVFGISQTYDGNNWYPSEVGQYNETPSSTMCRFVCNTNYDWDAGDKKCVARKTLTECSGKPAKSIWNMVDNRIVQTWNGDSWEPSEEPVFSENECSETCCFECKEHFNWNSEDRTCDPETQENIACTGLAENALWWNGVSTITQTWDDNSGDWYPSTTGTYKSDAGGNGCFFHCKEHHNWNQTYRKCDPDMNEANCTGQLPENAEWNVYTKITQTWDEAAQKYLPETTGTYNETPSPNECRFKCKDNYTYDGTNCAANTKQEPCTGLPAFASWWNTTVKKTWNGTGWEPNTVESRYSENAVENAGFCYFRCNENYEWNSSSNACAGKTQSADCDNETLPQNAVWWNDGTVTQTWNGYGWLPTTIGSYKSDGAAGDGCYFKCKDYHYRWDQAYRSCDCADGYFWDGSECISPCETASNTCGEHSVCKATSADTFDCECESGYVSENLQCKERRIWSFEDAWEDTSSGIISVDNSAEYHWVRSNAFGAKTGNYAMCYNADNYHSEMTINVNMPEDGVVAFYIRGIQDTTNHDIVFALYIDGESPSDMVLTNRESVILLTNGSSGNERTGWTDWTMHSFPLTAGSHALKFRYNSYRYQRFCIDDLTILPECSMSSGTPCFDPSSGMIWSAKQDDVTWYTAVDYCGNYSESGLGSWHLPNISELRTIARNCPDVETGGECSVIDTGDPSTSCLENSCQSSESCSCYDGGSSILSNSDYLWSSSSYEDNSAAAWTLWFNWAGINPVSTTAVGGVDARCTKAPCDEGYVWDGAKCVKQCTASLCSQSFVHSTGSCANDYACECYDGMFWNGSMCINPCSYYLPCNGLPHSNNSCTATAWNQYECGCENGYAWNGSECVTECSPTSGTPCYDPASGLTWSPRVGGVNWQGAVDYCEGSTYGGFTDWKLPTISELRTLIQNCAGTITGGACAVVDTDSASCLSYNECISNACRSCAYNTNGLYSKLGETDIIWSSSIDADDPDIYAWCLDFSEGMVESYQQISTHYTRCVR